MSQRFFVDAAVLAGERALLVGPQARQIATVLRLHAGDRLTLVRDGVDHEVEVERVSPREVTARVVARAPSANEPRIALTLGLPLLRGERSEEVVEATTQLGVMRIAPFVSERSVALALGDRKHARWERIARESAETARRGRVPAVDALRSWTELLGALPQPLFVAWEGERERHLADALPADAREVAFVIGPEGGLTDHEVDTARNRGAVLVTLGRRNLRSETAATAGVAEVMARLDR